MYTTILLPSDGSELAERAVPYARRLATSTGARVVLVRAHLPLDDMLAYRVEFPDESPGRLAEREAALSQQEFHAELERLQQQGLNVEGRFVEGRAADVIIETAREVQTDLIVMSTHGRGGVGDWLFGSVAQQTLRHCHIPILMISPRCSRDWDSHPLKRVLIPLDGSDTSAEILEPASHFTRALGAQEVIFLSVVDSPVVVYPDALVQPVSESADQANEAMQYLHGVTAHFAGDVQARLRFRVVEGDAASAILRVARDESIDAVAMATHGRAMLGHLVIGSVGLRTLERAEVPTLLYRPAPSETTPGFVKGATHADSSRLQEPTRAVLS